MSTRHAVFPAGRHDLYTSNAYSAAIRSGDLLLVSGQVGSRSDGTREPDFEAQVRRAFANLEATLKAGVRVRRHRRRDHVSYRARKAVRHDHDHQGRSLSASALSELDGGRRQRLAGVDFEIKVMARIPRSASARRR